MLVSTYILDDIADAVSLEVVASQLSPDVIDGFDATCCVVFGLVYWITHFLLPCQKTHQTVPK